MMYFGNISLRMVPKKEHSSQPKNKQKKEPKHHFASSLSSSSCGVGTILIDLSQYIQKRAYWMKYFLEWSRLEHFGDHKEPLITSVGKLIGTHVSLPKSIGKVYLLTVLRTLGCGWNPISVYYCLDSTNTLLQVSFLSFSPLSWRVVKTRFRLCLWISLSLSLSLSLFVCPVVCSFSFSRGLSSLCELDVLSFLNIVCFN